MSNDVKSGEFEGKSENYWKIKIKIADKINDNDKKLISITK